MGKDYHPQRGGGHSAGAQLGPTEPELCIQTGDLRSTRESIDKDLQQYGKRLALPVSRANLKSSSGKGQRSLSGLIPHEKKFKSFYRNIQHSEVKVRVHDIHQQAYKQDLEFIKK